MGPEYKTEIVPLASGYEFRNILWSQGRSNCVIEMPISDTSKRDELIRWLRAMKGRGHGFRFKDWTDYQVARTNGRLGTSTNGTGYPTYQLTKHYATGAVFEDRQIRKPVIGTVAIYRDSVLQTAGVGAGNYALDTTTGVVTFVANASSSVVSVTPGTTTSIILAGSVGVAIGGELYLSGLTGTIGATLNGIAHQVQSGTPPTYVISTNTTGLTWSGGGTGYRYPQETEVLDWSGEFDVPMRFAEDYTALTIEGPTVYRIDEVSLVEIRV